MLIELLTNAGFSPLQGEIMDFLIEKGESKAIIIAKNIKRPRGVVYRALDDLVERELVEKNEKTGEVARFRAEHPGKLEEIFAEKEKKAKEIRKSFSQILPNLVSAHNLTVNKPGVRFFEGDEGVKTALYDTLSSKTEVYTYADIEAIEKNLKEINDEYAKKRERLKIKKKIIVADTEENRRFFENFNQEITEVKFLKKEYYPFKSGMQIYDGKISYQTLDEINKIAVVVQDQHIYSMHRLFFEYMWENLN